MSNVLRLAIVDPNDASRETLKSMLLGMDIVWLEAECSRYEFFADVIGQTRPDIGVVALFTKQVAERASIVADGIATVRCGHPLVDDHRRLSRSASTP